MHPAQTVISSHLPKKLNSSLIVASRDSSLQSCTIITIVTAATLRHWKSLNMEEHTSFTGIKGGMQRSTFVFIL